ncbi:STAS domain-containing protein [bacterium]|nr:STAS domain-containing protein [bacterium]UNM10006.1 MAG: STAS domain-containing protein [Planctomycetales bacterium]
MIAPRILRDLKTYDLPTFRADLLAGLSVGVVALPLAMAFAIASGLPPERGLFTAIVAGLLISALGGSSVQIGGPTGAFVVIVAGISAQFGYNGLVMATLMAGLLLLLFGICRMGDMIRYIPFPVVTGFTAGIALIIGFTQLRDLLGLRMESPSAEFLPRLAEYLAALPTMQPASLVLGVATIVLVSLGRRYLPKFPTMLAVLVLISLAAHFLGSGVETIASRFGELPRALPAPAFPLFDYEMLRQLVGPAFTIAMLAAIESLLSATVADGMTGESHDPNTELAAQGIANIGSVLLGGIPATGAIARTATNVHCGARTPVAGIIHAISLALLLALLAPLAGHIPLCALAGILCVIAWNMSERQHFARILRAPRSDSAVLVITFLLTVLVDLTVAVEVGIVLASLLFIRRMSEVSTITSPGQRRSTDPLPDEQADAAEQELPDGVEEYEVQGAFFFGAASRFRETLFIAGRSSRVVILRMRNVPVMDATGSHLLREFAESCHRAGRQLVLSGVAPQPLSVLQRSGMLELIGADNVLASYTDAVQRAREIIDGSGAERE